jgi:hypothetical protein
MRNSGYKLFSFFGLCLVILLAGCMGSPIYRMWHKKQWMADEQYHPSLYQRTERLSSFRDRADEMTPGEQTRVAQELVRSLTEDPSPIYRGQVVRTLAVFSTPAATEGLRLALRDSDSTVRITACRAWSSRGGEEAARVLSQVVGSDTDKDVRMAAVRELAYFKTATAIPALGVALDDPDPALQHRAVQSLKSVTGKDFGNSVPAWRQYVRDGTVEVEETPTVAERLRRLF